MNSRFKSICLAIMAASAWSASAADLLVSIEDRAIERWRITEDALIRQGVFADASRASGFKPTGLAVSSAGVVYAGDSSGGGRIVMFGPDGKFRGVLATLGARPGHLCLSPDEKWLYVSQVLESRIFRLRLSDGKFSEYPLAGATGPRSLTFGPDGLLYVACRVSRDVRVYDVAGESGVLRGTLTSPYGLGGLALAGSCAERMVITGTRVEIVDLTVSRAEHPLNLTQNSFAACAYGKIAYVGDWTRGEIFRIDPQSAKYERVGTGARLVCAMAVLGDDGAARRREEYRKRAVNFALRTPVLPQTDDDFSRLKFNNPDGITWLKAGFAGQVHVTDYDKDGQLDLLVYSGWEGQVWEGCWFFRNTTPKGERDADPVFEAPRRVPRSAIPDVGTCRYADGTIIANVLCTNQCYEVRQLVDFDGDGTDDLFISASVQMMGTHDNSGYDRDGNWHEPQRLGYHFWCRGLGGKGAAARYGRPKIVRQENDEPISGVGWNPTLVRDWDGDGDLDIILCDYNDTFTYYENIGTRTNPVYTAGCFLRYPDGGRLAGYQCMPSVEAVDWDGDGKVDIVRCEEEGRVYWYRNTGKLARGLPVFERPRFFRQQAGDLCSSAMAAPWVFDFDGDGDQDLLSGDTAGTLDFFENLSGPGVEKPKWAPPRKLTTPDGKQVHILAGPSGSMQGPFERMYGYTSLSVNDWDGDGLPDLMVNSVWGKIVWFRNIGTRREPKLDFARDVEVEWDGAQPAIAWHNWFKPEATANPKGLIISWRTTPVMIDWNRDGLMDLVAMDVDGDLGFYERAKRKDGSLYLKPPRKAFQYEDGKPMLLAYSWLGGPKNRWEGRIGLAGRRKFCFCDWDGDGKTDIVMNGYPNQEWWRQVSDDGKTWRFAHGGNIGELNISTHDPQPCACDFNADGRPDIVVGAMDGYFYYHRNPRSNRGAALPKELLSSAYRVKVNGKSVDVMGIPAPTMHDGQFPEDALHPYYATFFESADEVEIEIASDGINLGNAILRPTTRGIEAKTRSRGKISFRAKPPFVLAVEPNGRHRALIVSGKLPERDQPSAASGKVRYFGPGRHHFDKPIQLKAGETMYLAAGACVEAAVIGKGDDITICGRGILSGQCWNWCCGPMHNMVQLTGRNIRIEGITIIGSYQWTLVLEQCENAVVDGINILNGRVLNDDGIDIVRSRNTTIRNCFIRSQDDCITPKHWCEGLKVENCMLWTDVANIFRIGYECDGPGHAFGDFQVKGVDILHQSVRKVKPGELWSENAIYIQASNDMEFRNMAFEDLRFDAPETGDNLACIRTQKTNDRWQQHKMAGEISGVTIRGVEFANGLPKDSESIWIENNEPNRRLEKLRIEDFSHQVTITRHGKIDQCKIAF